MTQAQATGVTRDYLESVGKLAALGAALLPAFGFVVRYVAFWAAGVRGSSSAFAWGAPVAQLATTGMLAVIPALATLGLVWFFMLRERSPARRFEAVLDASPRERRRALLRLNRRIALAVLAASFLFFVMFYPDFPGTQLSLVVGLPAAPFVPRAMKHPASEWFRHYWPALVMLLLGASISGGLGGSLPGVAASDFTIASGASVHNGHYQELAHEGGRVVLEPCDPRHRETFIVRETDVVLIRPIKARSERGASLWGLIHGRSLALGLKRCRG